MKTRLFFAVLLMCGLMPAVAQPVAHVNTRDTVRYGDPWYTFKPLPALNYVAQYGGQLFLKPYPNARFAQVYTSSKTLLYGIAVTMDSLPAQEDSAWLSCWRGIFTHPGPPLRMEYVCFDSVPSMDSISTWNPPLLKQCVFEYQVGGAGDDGVYKSTTPVNCFEFYFDEPLPLVPQDTFLIGSYSNMADPYHFLAYAGVDRDGASQNWMEINLMNGCDLNAYDTMAKSADHYRYLCSLYPNNSYFCNTDGRGRLFWFWGMVFPITELRCTKPWGLEVDSAARMVRWDHDADGVLFQLSLCVDGTLPDNGYIVTTTDTTLSFTALLSLSPDTVYRLYLRKQCDFSTSRPHTVWSDWSEPVVLNRNAGGGTEGIPTIGQERVRIYAEGGRIVVVGAEGMEVKVYDVKGIQVANRDLPAGVYMVHVGDLSARKVVVVR
ncbi:MAG: hypothetical protein J6Y52_06355 [Bacteroidales bacterium]|nr:hypothetical protein [Bacteroidales bacterium]